MTKTSRQPNPELAPLSGDGLSTAAGHIVPELGYAPIGVSPDWHIRQTPSRLAARARAFLANNPTSEAVTQPIQSFEKHIEDYFEATQLPPEVREEGRALIDDAVALHAPGLLGWIKKPILDEATLRVKRLVFPDSLDDIKLPPSDERLFAEFNYYNFSANLTALGDGDRLQLAHSIIVIARDIIVKNPRIKEILGTPFKAPELNIKAQAIVESSNFYQTLLSFDTETPVDNERPLTPHEKMVRIAQERDQIYRRHGVERTAHSGFYPNASRELGRASLWIDDETQRGARLSAEENEAEKFKLAQAFIKQHFTQIEVAAFEEFGPVGNSVSQELTAAKSVATYMFKGTKAEGMGSYISIVHRLVDQLIWTDFPEHRSGVPIQKGDYQKLLDEALDDSDWLSPFMDEIYYHKLVGFRLADYFSMSPSSANNFTTPRVPETMFESQGVSRSFAPKPPGTIGGVTEQKAASSYEDTQESVSIGRVIKFSLPAGVRNAMRFIKTSTHDIEIPQDLVTFATSDAVLLFKASQPASLQLDGFTTTDLVNGSIAYFNYDRDSHDPDDYCFVPVESIQLHQLIQRLSAAGLDKIANAFLKHQPKTVAEIEIIMAGQMRYVDEERPSMPIARLEDCKQLQGTNGLLEVQCTGANTVLQLVVQELFGPGKTKLVGGLAVNSNDNDIMSIGHQKLPFVHKGKMYYLDATPSIKIGEREIDSVAEKLAELKKIEQQKRTETPPSETEITATLTQKDTVTKMTESERKVALEGVFENEALKLAETWTGLPKGTDDELNGYRMKDGKWRWFVSRRQRMMDAVIARGSEDLLNITVRAVGGAINGKVRDDEVQSTIEYLRTLQNIGLNERMDVGRNLGVKIAQYNDASLNLMIRILEKTRKILRE